MNSKALNTPYEMFTVGFDDLFNRAMKPKEPNFPPYNIIKTGEYSYAIEMAVAGFSEDDISVTLEKGSQLVVEGEVPQSEMDYDYLHRGIANRSFRRTFAVAEDVVVQSATHANGILTINMNKIVPEEKKSRKIPIENTNKSKSKFLRG